jgi:hypothetical protein
MDNDANTIGSETPKRARSERGEVENEDQAQLDDEELNEPNRTRTGAGE